MGFGFLRKMLGKDDRSDRNELPFFKYHPDPLATGAIVRERNVCECCGKESEYKYCSCIYAEEEIEMLCPWCIADGAAARKFDCFFSEFDEAQGVDSAVIDEVTERTPGYESWQDTKWFAHCGDACEFHGDASQEDLLAMTGDDLDIFFKEYGWTSIAEWKEYVRHYEKGGNPAVYKFKCRKCGKLLFHMDRT